MSSDTSRSKEAKLEGSQAETAAKPALMDRFAPWLRPSLTRRTFKTFARCLLVLLAALVLMLAQKSLVAMGQAAFFAALLTMMLPPSMPISIFFLAALTLLLGMLLGWAWGCLGMAAGVAARSSTLLASQYQTVAQDIGNNPDATAASYVFQGVFLDTRSSAVFGALFFVWCFAMGALRAHLPKLTLLSIFGTIVADIMFSYGPLFPTRQFMLASTFLIPTSSYVAIALVGLAVIFPESMSHVWLSGYSRGVLAPSLALLANQDDLLNLPHPLDQAHWRSHVAKGKKLRAGLVEASQGLQGSTGMVDLEVVVGKVGPGDLKTLDGLLKVAVYRTLAMGNFSNQVLASLQADEAESDHQNAPHAPSSNEKRIDPAHPSSRFSNLRRGMKQMEELNGHDLSILIPILARTSLALRQGCKEGLEGVQAYVDDVNSTRWSFVPLLGKKGRTDLPDIEAIRVSLQERLVKFQETERRELVEGPFGKYFGQREKSEKMGMEERGGSHTSSRSLFLCFVFTTTLESYVETLLDLLSTTAHMQQKRTRNRLWFPTGFGKLLRKLGDSGGATSDVIGGDALEAKAAAVRKAEQEAEEDEEKEESNGQLVGCHRSLARNPDASPPRSKLGRFGVKISKVVQWQRSPQGLFALRHAVGSLCIWVVAIHPRTAHFNYINRGVWALIMLQTSLAVFAGEQIAGFILRLGGTLIGLVVGMLAWYVGAGRGNGNPYGIAASTVFFTSPFLYARIVLPQAKAAVPLMAGVTIIFVVGYSWLDTHLTVQVNSGVGVELAWKRALLVIIGFAAGFVVMCFPKMSTARVLVRKTTSRVSDEIAGIFISEVEALLQEESVARTEETSPLDSMAKQPSADHAARKERNLKRIGKRVVALVDQMQALTPSLTTAKFEPQLQGVWPAELYEELLNIQWKIIISFALLSSSLAKLEPQWCALLVRHSPFLNADLITDILATLTVTSQCLLSKRPLPPSVHSLRDRVVYHERNIRLNKLLSSQSPRGTVSSDDGDDSSTLRSDPGTVDGISLGIDFTLETATDPQFAIYSTAIIALSSLVYLFDSQTNTVRKLVGESAKLTLLREWEGRGLALEEEGRRRRTAGTRPRNKEE